jgi:hypothetical protein
MRTVVVSAALVLSVISVTQARLEPPITRAVVAAGQAAPGGGVFEHFTVESLPVIAPVNDEGRVAFFATLLRGRFEEGIFVTAGTRIVKVAATGDPVAGGGTISGFGRHPVPSLNRRGAVAFAAAVAGGRTVEGIFVSAEGRRRAVALAGGAAAGIPAGTFASLDAPALADDGSVAFLATVRRGREAVEAVYVARGGSIRKIVAQGDPAPSGGTFTAFGPPAITNAGAVAFSAIVDGADVAGGVFVADRTAVRLLVGAGEDLPGGGIFAKFSERVAVNDAGAVAFTAIVKGGTTDAAIFVHEGGRLRKVVALGDAAPGGGAFSYLGLFPAVDGSGHVAFVASTDGGSTPIGVFVARASGIDRAVGLGDALPGGATLRSFGLYPAVSMSPSGTLAFATAAPAGGEGDGVAGIFVVVPAGRTRGSVPARR